jgi:hypothetical protein
MPGKQESMVSILEEIWNNLRVHLHANIVPNMKCDHGLVIVNFEYLQNFKRIVLVLVSKVIRFLSDFVSEDSEVTEAQEL